MKKKGMLETMISKLGAFIIVFGIIVTFFLILTIGSRGIKSAICHGSIQAKAYYESVQRAGLGVASITGWHPPPLCAVRKRNTKDINETTEVMTTEIGACWRTYGGGKLDALAGQNENPARCSRITSNTKGNLTPKKITSEFKEKIVEWEEELDCTINETRCCPEGYSCYKSDPRYCSKRASNVFECENQRTFGSYEACPSGYTEESVSRERCYQLFPQRSCKDGCYYNASEDTCLSLIDDSECGEPSLPTMTSEKGCKYCNSSYEQIPPEGCVLKASTNKSCVKTKTFYEYFKPGKKTLYSFSWINESGKRETKLVATDNRSIYNKSPKISGEYYTSIIFLDTFTETAKPPEIRELPGECAGRKFVDSSEGCANYCARAGISSLVGVTFAKSLVASPLKTAVAAGVGFTHWKSAKFWAQAGFQASGIPQCAKCIANKYLQLGVDLVPLGDTVLVCVYERK